MEGMCQRYPVGDTGTYDSFSSGEMDLKNFVMKTFNIYVPKTIGESIIDINNCNRIETFFNFKQELCNENKILYQCICFGPDNPEVSNEKEILNIVSVDELNLKNTELQFYAKKVIEADVINFFSVCCTRKTI